jgi:hypothetical protein
VTPEGPQEAKRGPWPYVLVLSLLALIPRLGALDPRLGPLGRSLSYDELFTLTNFSQNLLEALTGQKGANNHPMASVLAWAVRQVSESEVALRLPFVVLGALAAGALCWALWPLGRRRAWLAGGVLALAPPAVLASQQVRGYAGAILFGALALGAYLRCARAGGQRNAAMLAVFGALGLWSHATLALGLLALGAQSILVPGRAGLACRQGVIGAFMLGAVLWSKVIAKTFKFVVRNVLVGPAGGYHPGPLTLSKLVEAAGGPALAAGLCALAIGGLWLARRRAAEANPEPFQVFGRRALWLWALAPAPLLLLAALGFGRFAWFAWPAWAGLAAAGCLWSKRPVGTLVAALWLGLAAWQVPSQNRVEIHDLQGALAVAAQRSAQLDNATVIALGPGSELLPFYGQALAIEPDQAESILPFLLMEPAVVVVPLPAALDERLPTQGGKPLTLRQILAEAGLTEPLVLPGLESPVLVFSSRSP